jgi:L-arabinose isomerase
VVIDSGTTIPRLRMDLQAGAAYHRLAAGLVGGG